VLAGEFLLKLRSGGWGNEAMFRRINDSAVNNGDPMWRQPLGQ
jgi:hypothetical protein